MQFKQSIKNKVYIEHLYSLFENFCNSIPKMNTYVDNRLGKKELNESIKFWTLSLPCFNEFRELFYDKTGQKRIPIRLYDLITARSLAYWVMDDGYKSSNGFYLCTESYTLEENENLCLMLKKKFFLDCSIHKHTNGHRLYINKKSKENLLFLIRPYLITHFYYKFDI